MPGRWDAGWSARSRNKPVRLWCGWPGAFSGYAYERKAYLAKAGCLAAGCFERLEIGKDEPVTVCTGHALDGVCSWLTASGYTWQRDKIAGPLQELAERALQAYLCSLGFEVDYSLLTDPRKKGLFWWHQVKWLKGGNPYREGYSPERAQVCQTGWWSFRYWAGYPYSEAKRLVAQVRAEQRSKRWRKYGRCCEYQ